MLTAALSGATFGAAHAQDAQTAPEQPEDTAVAQGGEPQRSPDRFFIAALDVVGANILAPAEIERLVYQFTGPDKSGQDVDAARKAIQDAYAAKGYEAVIVDIPTQETALFQQGIVQIRVNESPVGAIQVVDARHHGEGRIRSDLPSLQEGKPLDLKALQSDLAAANRFPDRTVSPAFKPGKEPGSIDVDLNVQDSLPIHASAELNNDNSPSTTDLRASGSVRYSNLFGAGHTLSVSAIVAPRAPRESKVFSGSYLAPFIGSPWSVLVYGYNSNSNVAALGGTNVLGDGFQIGLRGIYRLPTKTTSQSVSFGVDYKDFNQKIFVGGVNAGTTPINYLPLVVEYNFARGGEYTQFDASLGMTAGIRAIKKVRQICTAGQVICSPVDQFQDKAVDSAENFFRLNLGLNYQYSTKSDIVLKLGLNGQLADTHLVSNEQFGLGGSSSVRGYYQSEAVADNGVGGSLEIQSPSLATVFGTFVDELRFFGFVDAGYTYLLGRVPTDQAKDFTLVGAGGGLRIRLLGHLSGNVIAGVPLVAGPVSKKGDPRVTFQVKSEF
ncbi:ShlB/FhaC/HecB family hemolysin secretion/activation protein [Novosphingobium sp. MMS21-SN21R]|uniref:ShlB/FhaC/HecB family hemolysin secretion/activation protein n=1 Tax=Novosphingobium sp. MMS21-SN21R TaxID=2969298 RepID=UPI0028853008|nr:ShlB/FhaC/HecB family hemolysin secretion/activation protein [Novosphingobium sp. MMS21-SN21R]MDT0508419.1 ShlB/FhaC/HecB family hemolysin secretion/activation protein [Novosphingobium sp. MMS21-SN21R]